MHPSSDHGETDNEENGKFSRGKSRETPHHVPYGWQTRRGPALHEELDGSKRVILGGRQRRCAYVDARTCLPNPKP